MEGSPSAALFLFRHPDKSTAPCQLIEVPKVLCMICMGGLFVEHLSDPFGKYI
jgi:hypothetical protein